MMLCIERRINVLSIYLWVARRWSNLDLTWYHGAKKQLIQFSLWETFMAYRQILYNKNFFCCLVIQHSYNKDICQGNSSSEKSVAWHTPVPCSLLGGRVENTAAAHPPCWLFKNVIKPAGMRVVPAETSGGGRNSNTKGRRWPFILSENERFFLCSGV